MKRTRCERLLLEISPFTFVCFCFSSLENYFGLGTTNVKGKTDHLVSLRWKKSFEHFQRGEYFSDCSFDLFVTRYPEISPSFRRAELKPAFFN